MCYIYKNNGVCHIIRADNMSLLIELVSKFFNISEGKAIEKIEGGNND